MKNLICLILYAAFIISGTHLEANTIPKNLTSKTIMATYYGSPNGNGSACTLANPCSLEGVRNKVRTVNKNMSGNIIIKLLPGTYVRNTMFKLNTEDSGTNGFYIIYEASDKLNRPVISGGQQVSGWTLHDSEKNIYKASVGNKVFRQLYVNGNRATRSRTPSTTENIHYGPYFEGNLSVSTANKTIQIPASEIENWDRLNQVELVMIPHWYHLRLRIDSFSKSEGIATIIPSEPERNSALLKKDEFYNKNGDTYYYFENALEFLDSEGEWYLNTDNATVYYKPGVNENMTSDTIVVPSNVESLMSIYGTPNNPAHHIQIKNIEFEYTNWMQPSKKGTSMTQGNQISVDLRNDEGEVVPSPGFGVKYANNLRFEGNVFSKLGGVGIEFYQGTNNIEIIGNVLYDISSNGIVLDITTGKNPIIHNQLTEVVVANNFITRVGRDYSNGQGILAGFVKDIIIEHNEISDFGYSGMQIGQQSGGNVDVGMANNIIRNNEIHHIGQQHDDGAGIYTLSRQPRTRIYENWVYKIQKGPWASTYNLSAIYQDNYSELITVESNVLEMNDNDIYEQTRIGAKNNSYLNNDSKDQAVIDKAGLQPAYTFIKNVVPPKVSDSSNTNSINKLKR
ncbi:right-handed parallel beta-helix repeat-containing protein [Arenibacter sp. F26102]|uniref:right-handed parallel beta-helix repeat-containing protein n=1 Tax=Arenibacter sp. F26102 TaxID=2926416 RepID=UPI001FF5216E|nr:right-handed parallel beta-helix repeat-containing protein [Arenibacter sp. F26102]MCK0147282.1 right-handed parallel beta-helix repeat-containing protein [Arenibacter sp. F26102]